MDESALFQQFDRFRTEMRADLAAHEERDGQQFASLQRGQDEMDAKLMNLVTARAEQVGAARAIAELAETRGKRNTAIVSFVAVASTVVTLLIQKHWLGF